jgi:hypothetical protein
MRSRAKVTFLNLEIARIVVHIVAATSQVTYHALRKSICTRREAARLPLASQVLTALWLESIHAWHPPCKKILNREDPFSKTANSSRDEDAKPRVREA